MKVGSTKYTQIILEVLINLSMSGYLLIFNLYSLFVGSTKYVSMIARMLGNKMKS